MSITKYPTYKAAGLKWLEVIPSHWKVRRLKQFCDVFPSNIDKKSVEGETQVRLCNYTDVYYNDLVADSLEFMAATATDEQIEKFSLKAGDTIITKDSETADDIAIAAYVPQDLPGVICGYHLSMVRPKEAVNGAFVKRLFDSIYTKSLMAVRANGLTRVGLSQYAIDNIELPLPPKEEQASITAFLDRETAKIDALIAEQKRLVEIFKLKLSSLALSGFQDEEPNYQRIGRVTRIVSRPVDIKVDEEYEPLGLFNRGRGIFHKESRRGADMGDSDFFYVEAGDLVLSGQFAWEGSVAVADKSESGCVVSHRYPIIQGDNENCLTEFLLALLWTEHGDFVLNQCSRGAAGRNRPLNLGLLLKEEIALPCLTIQRAIQEEYRKYVGLKNEQAKQTGLALERRSALISAAVTGQIDVRGLVEVRGSEQ